MRRINYLLIVALSFISSSLAAQDWQTDIEVALSIATAEQKNVILVFQGSDWCGPCIKLHKEVWDTPEFEAFAGAHLVSVKVDFPRRKQNALSPEQVAHNEALAEKYNSQGAFPLVVILDTTGKVMGKTGYKNIGLTAYLDHLNSFLQ